MLNRLSIRNIVLVESAELELGSGLIVLSGETGAGKSILLDALALALGTRADANLIRKGETQGQVSAEFDISNNARGKEILAELGFEPADEIIIRRTVSADGKTRCLINDAPVTVAGLKKLGESLVEVHGQHDQRTLQDREVHRDLLDDYAGLASARKALGIVYHAWKEAASALDALKTEIEKAERERDYLEHMHKELSDLAPKAGEEKELAASRTRMMQSEKLFEILNGAISELNAGKGASGALRAAERLLSRSPLTSSGSLATVAESLGKVAVEIDEAQAALEQAGRDNEYSQEKLERTEERLFALKAAGRKYNLPVEELPALAAKVGEKLKLITSQSNQSKALAAKEAETKAAYKAMAEKLSASRKKASAKLEKSVEAELAPLKMENTRFRVRVEPLEEPAWNASGMDTVYFECATNVAKGAKDIAFASLNRIASGGELSRFMLALKVALRGAREAGSLIFDEIDSGTGGAVADAIGQRLAKLGTCAQVLVVTHLPQVAARGNQHLLVSKRKKGVKIITEIDALNRESRQEELARMLAGAEITAEARKAAQKLLEEAA